MPDLPPECGLSKNSVGAFSKRTESRLGPTGIMWGSQRLPIGRLAGSNEPRGKSQARDLESDLLRGDKDEEVYLFAGFSTGPTDGP